MGSFNGIRSDLALESENTPLEEVTFELWRGRGSGREF